MSDLILFPGVDSWPENVYTDKLRTWLLEESDDEITWPTERICNIAASLAETLPTIYRMVTDADGGIVFTTPYNYWWRYHIWDNGEVDRIDMQDGKVVKRDRIRTVDNLT